MEPGESKDTVARLQFIDDATGYAWALYWGVVRKGGGGPNNDLLTNLSAPVVTVERVDDGSGLRQWTATSTAEEGLTNPRLGSHTAFLWLRNLPHGPKDYQGAYDVSFRYTATEIP